MNREDNKNLILAILLSVLVFVGWTYFYGAPQMERQRQDAEMAQSQQEEAQGQQQNIPVPGEAQMPAPDGSAEPAAPTGALPGVAVEQTREAALAANPRVMIDTASKRGSLNLRGARIDDIVLKDYQENVEDDSDNIVLLSPTGSADPYYAEFGWVGDVPGGLPDSQSLWEADRDQLTPDAPVTLTWENEAGIVFSRVVAIDDNAMFTIEDRVDNQAEDAVTVFPYGLVSRHGEPETIGFFILHEGLIGVLGEEGLQEYSYDNVLDASRITGSVRGTTWADNNGGWLGITDKYWAATIIPDQTTPFQGRFTVDEGGNRPIFQTDVLGQGLTIAPGETGGVTQRLFAGAKEVDVIDGYQDNYGILRFDLLIDWGWFYFITKPMFYALDFFNALVGNFGVAILIVTVLLKILFLPLANKSYASMAKMKAVQPEMMSIRDRYKDDRMKQQQELMELYKREKINPVAGCWPVLIQIPVFFALYKVLFVSIEMRHAPFFGWIQDLAAPDPTSIFNLFGLLPFAVPALLTVGVWPILMGITMFVQMKMNPEPADPIQKAVFTWMPVIFTFLLASFPAGLVIYWAWNNFLSVLQQGFIMRRHGVKIELWDNLRKLITREKPEPDGPKS
ncbi:MAG: membrane protein insertase yidC [Saliniramus fredricksonii]|uniref:Membrane protein insertase YidC n=1 Tax=Saliniramus fredricksonii TaxID=1653334 RepID=A0A0N8KE31_9HYPH|nr:membrane protein insertase YidC [Saliniramus fredricksonii]KPQ10202.1 MAG: membrane protein insertase yidC [Saliniramus fredricksonii]SCC80938.1 YidC/Oxa1 family membrane protein insertase [Saliniramus fredricksonii]